MTEKQKKEYEEECYKSGNLDYPLAGCILSQLCTICKNYDYRIGTWDPPVCKILGKVPDDINACKKYNCEYFEHDKHSKSNVFFDENFQPKNTYDD